MISNSQNSVSTSNFRENMNDNDEPVLGSIETRKKEKLDVASKKKSRKEKEQIRLAWNGKSMDSSQGKSRRK